MRVIVDMPADLVADLDREARDLDRSRAWVIRHRCTAGPASPAASRAVAGHSFEPQGRNALKCATCGGKRANH